VLLLLLLLLLMLKRFHPPLLSYCVITGTSFITREAALTTPQTDIRISKPTPAHLLALQPYI